VQQNNEVGSFLNIRAADQEAASAEQEDQASFSHFVISCFSQCR
jgi:hypothetical protein